LISKNKGPEQSGPFSCDVENMSHRFKCATCAQWHEGWPDIGYDQPHYTKDISETERDRRVFLTSDLCVLDNESFFVRCLLFLNVEGTEDNFAWGVWSSLSKANFQRYQASYDDDMSEWDPMFGYLANRLPHYPDTLSLKLSVQPGKRGERPTVELEPTDHPLAVDQRDGLAFEKLLEIVGPFLAH
jgi:hypothetical protein